MDPQGDAERRIADLEHQLAQERRIAELERELAQTRAQHTGPEATDVGDLLGTMQGFRLDAGGSGGRPAAGRPADTRLSAAPRAVPARFVLAELLPFRWWYLFAMFVVAIPPIIVWITTPRLVLPVAIALVVALYAWHSAGSLKRFALLRWGQVVTVVGIDIDSQARYFGGTTWYNAPLPVAAGWRVTRPLWSGPSTKTLVRYTLDGQQGMVTLRGREYTDGVILADQRHPERARCVTYFPYDLDRGESGDWTGRLRPRLVLGMIVWLVVLIGWLGGAAALSSGVVATGSPQDRVVSLGRGQSASVSSNSPTKTVACTDGGDLTVGGSDNVVTVTGHCTSLTVLGIGNSVTIDAVDSVVVSGIDNHVTYRTGTPAVSKSGIDNTVGQG